MANKRIFVYRDGKIVEITKNLKERKNLQSTGEYHDNLHACHSMDDIRQQHMTDSNRAENAYNKQRGN